MRRSPRGANSNVRQSRTVGSVRPSRSCRASNYVEYSSDDDHDDSQRQLLLPSSSDEPNCPNELISQRDRTRQSDLLVNDSSDADDREDNEDDFDFKIQQLLASRKLSASEWRILSEHISTAELTKGSVLQQPDDEFYSSSPALIEKFLVKWDHSSYLHASWETEADLIELVGITCLQQNIKKLRKRERGELPELFEDLVRGEYFPAQYLQVERILDIEHPSCENDCSGKDRESNHLRCAVGHDGSSQSDEVSSVKAILDESSTENGCWVSIKWVGLPYSSMSTERLEDLVNMKIDSEQALLEYYRRMNRTKKRTKTLNRSLDSMSSYLNQQDPPLFCGRQLRDYQWQGVRWMLYNWSQKRNCILADEMGLGKTIQSSIFLQLLKTHKNVKGPFLIVAPLSTLVNWHREISSWTDFDSIIYHGSHEDRALIRKYEFGNIGDGLRVEIVITSPETCIAMDNSSGSRRALSKVDWELIVVDEAHKLKNFDSRVSTVLRDEYLFRNCLLLTGTPLQNSIGELWTLLNFIDRQSFSDKEAFTNKFGNMTTAAQLEDLQTLVSPYLLRREKEHVEKTVPPKEELIVEVELTIPQKQYYRAIYEQNTAFLFRGSAKDGPRLSNLAMEVRKCCNHPFLIKGGRSALAEHFASDSPSEVLIKASGKMMLLDKLLPKLQADGHRVLIFSQFRTMLDILEDFLAFRGFSYERVDGAITGKKRQSAIDRYSAPAAEAFVMLLSTRAGGVGINLTSADTVIIYDSDWNPQNDLQAQARAHRIGQTKLVKVYRLLTRKTYEMVMFKAASLKLGLDYAVMHNLNLEKLQASAPGFDSIGSLGTHERSNPQILSEIRDCTDRTKGENASSLSKRELENLLKNGAYDIFREEKDGIGDELSKNFYDDDIDIILQRSAVVLHDSTGGSKMSKVSSAFSKAAFVATSETGPGNDVALDDPDFWTKVVGMQSNQGKDSTGRKRKCTLEVGSYKEPSMSIRQLEDGVHPQGAQKAISEKLPMSHVPAVWTSDCIQRLASAVASRGYGNWETIRSDTKLNWSIYDISRGCRIAIIWLLYMSSLPVGQESDNSSDNVVFISNHLCSLRACRVALICELLEPIERQTIQLLEESIDMRMFSEIMRMPIPAMSDSAECNLLDLRDDLSYDSFLRLLEPCRSESDADSQGAHMSALLRRVVLLISDFQACDRNQKSRLVAKNRLYQVEDLFDVTLSTRNNVKMTMEATEIASNPLVENEVESSIQAIPLHIFLRKCEQSSLALYRETTSDWSALVDCQLIESVCKVGWPEGKRKVSALHILMHKDYENSISSGDVETSMYQRSVLRRIKDLVSLLRATASPKLDSPTNEKLLQVEAKASKVLTKTIIKTLTKIGRPRTVYCENSRPSMVTVDEAVGGPPSFTSTFDASEVLLSWAEFMEEIGLPNEQLHLDRVQSLVRLIITTYDAWVLQNDGLSATDDCAINDGECLHIETTVDGSNESGQHLKASGMGKVIDSGPLSGFSYKQLDVCMERCYVIHQVRQLIILHVHDDFNRLKQVVKKYCKHAGISCPASRRDLSLPAWWTLDHDILLLKVFAIECSPSSRRKHNFEGADDSEKDTDRSIWDFVVKSSVLVAAPGFRVPVGAGIKWATALVPKVAEKRLMMIISAARLDEEKSVHPSEIPSSPEPRRPLSRITADLEPIKGIMTYGMRPSWVTSLATTTTVNQPNPTVSSCHQARESSVVPVELNSAPCLVTNDVSITIVDAGFVPSVHEKEHPEVVPLDMCSSVLTAECTTELSHQPTQKKAKLVSKLASVENVTRPPCPRPLWLSNILSKTREPLNPKTESSPHSVLVVDLLSPSIDISQSLIRERAELARSNIGGSNDEGLTDITSAVHPNAEIARENAATVMSAKPAVHCEPVPKKAKIAGASKLKSGGPTILSFFAKSAPSV